MSDNKSNASSLNGRPDDVATGETGIAGVETSKLERKAMIEPTNAISGSKSREKYNHAPLSRIVLPESMWTILLIFQTNAKVLARGRERHSEAPKTL